MDTSEKDFEATIERTLVGGAVAAPGAGPGVVREDEALYGRIGLKGYRKRTSNDYDRTLCLDTGMLFDFIRVTQIKTWEKLKEQHGEQVKEHFLKRLTSDIKSRGTLDVLRNGVIDLGCKFDLAYFTPESGLNEEHLRLYRANCFSVIRQLHYSERSEKSVDMVIFLNGLPIFTAEIKNPEKGQTVENAIKQYKKDRDPKEPLLAFGRCLAHFAVDTDLVYMTTHLRGNSTRFLPFNKGHNRGAGNPPNPKGFKTAYLWEEIWQPDSVLEIINHFVQTTYKLDESGGETRKKELIFPRYHQLGTVRRLIRDARQKGPGQNYLIQHSAGSGKSNSIAWLAHQLAGLHNVKDERVFDSIIVVTDRRVLDWQLQQTVKSFEQVKGLVVGIDRHKSAELAKALAEGKDIIVTTLQTFPFVTEKITEMLGQRFAVIVDEAHSSQTGEASRTLKQVLAAPTLDQAAKEDKDGEPYDEDEVNRVIEEMISKTGRLPNVSFFAFTATPKSKTLELFGTPLSDGTLGPFSLYSMRQAIEEDFILDVLKNYTTFAVYFGLLKKVEDDPNYPRGKAVYLLKSYVDLHEHNIRKKTEIMAEHFDTQIKNRIGGQAKAMLVTRSRLHAVRYRRSFDTVLRERNAKYKALVAFSGTVRDPDTGEEFTESGMNGFPERQTPEAFKKSEYRFLIVANKFQTGFDQPLLHTMYVDKKLSYVNAVQTLSRLNRIYPCKEDTMVLDFANSADEIQNAFQPFYETTLLSEPTDPNKLYDLKRTVEEFLVFYKDDVETFANIYFSRKGTQQKLRAVLDPVLDRYKGKDVEEQEQFRKAVVDYLRLYAFLSHILTFKDAGLEKLYQFLRLLRPLLPLTHERLPIEITDNVNVDSYRIQQTSTGGIALIKEDGMLEPVSELGTGERREDEKVPLSEIIRYINDNYGTDFTDEDKVRYFTEDMERRLVDQEGLQQALNPDINPSEENRRLAFAEYFNDILEDMIDANVDIYKKITEDEPFGDIFRLVMFKKVAERLSKETA